MGSRLLEYFYRVERENIGLGEARMALSLGISKAKAGTIEDTPELLDKAESVFQRLISTRDLFTVRR